MIGSRLVLTDRVKITIWLSERRIDDVTLNFKLKEVFFKRDPFPQILCTAGKQGELVFHDIYTALVSHDDLSELIRRQK